jgi:hypothetical protein
MTGAAGLKRKNRQQGTSAPTLATVWSGPVEVLGALGRAPQFAGLLVEEIVVERESRFDAYGGHDITTSSCMDACRMAARWLSAWKPRPARSSGRPSRNTRGPRKANSNEVSLRRRLGNHPER